MKAKIFILVISLIVSINIYGQSETPLFRYERTEKNFVSIFPNNEINHVLNKGKAIFEPPHDGYIRPWHGNAIVKPFQELIDSKVFSKKRMKELEKGDRTTIEVTFDETGVISYVCFYFNARRGEKSLLTEQELYAICQKYKGVVYDLSRTEVFKSETGSKTVFYNMDSFKIPFEDLKY